ncbi:MAG: trehalose-phosphatase [Candidatus Thermoplasmatota archaeon]|nr:trehalose-phosphatase [Candidatus Thermoplasmatota archaeon]
MPDFLNDHLLRIQEKIRKSDQIFLFLDYDGTLVFFKEKPTDVTTPEHVKKIIRQLIKNQKMTVIIVTGRPLQEIRNLLNIRGLSFIALHGLSIQTPNELQYSWEQAAQARLIIKAIKNDMQEKLKDDKRAFLEDKELTLVLHYRLLPSRKARPLREAFKTTVHTLDKKKILEVMNGAKVIEARPKGWNKGKAVELFLARHENGKNNLPIYIGDDITDEDAFHVLTKKGITIHVANTSRRKTAARYMVSNPDEVFSFLQFLHQELYQN